MLAVAQPYFESDDFRGDVILHAAFPHPLLKHLIRFECGLDRLMRTDDRTDALFRYFEPRVYQRNRAHKVQLCKASLLVNQRERRRRLQGLRYFSYYSYLVLSSLGLLSPTES